MEDTHKPEEKNQGEKTPQHDEIIELTDVAKDAAEGQEPVIELTDVAKDAAEAQEPVIELSDVIQEIPEEPIFEFTDVVEASSPQTPDASEDEVEKVIDLTDMVQEPFTEIVETPEPYISDLEETTPLDNGIVESMYETNSADEDMTESLGVNLESGMEGSEIPSISREQIEAAIERVVKEMLSEKIENLLIKIIEKEVSKEVERLKDLLLDDSTGSDGR